MGAKCTLAEQTTPSISELELECNRKHGIKKSRCTGECTASCGQNDVTQVQPQLQPQPQPQWNQIEPRSNPSPNSEVILSEEHLCLCAVYSLFKWRKIYVQNKFSLKLFNNFEWAILASVTEITYRL